MFFEFSVWSELVVLVNKHIDHNFGNIHLITRFLKADLDGTIFAYDYSARLAYFHDFRPSRRAQFTRYNLKSRIACTYDIHNVS